MKEERFFFQVYICKFFILIVSKNQRKSCQQCQVGKFSLIEGLKAEICYECPQSAKCVNGEIFLKPGKINTR